MKKSDVLSGAAVLLSASALMVGFVTGRSFQAQVEVGQANQKETVQQLEQRMNGATQALREELVGKLDAIIAGFDLPVEEADALSETDPLEGKGLKALARTASQDPAVAALLREGIRSVILEAMGAELAATDWSDTLAKEKLEKMLKRATDSQLTFGTRYSDQEVDMSDLEEVDAQVARILEEFEGRNSYSSNNALVKQLIKMGDEAVEPLLEMLDAGMGHEHFAKRMAVVDALEGLLTEEDEEIILDEFTRTGNFAKLIDKYQFPAAEEELMNKITRSEHGGLNNYVVDAALKMNPDRSIPLLVDHVRYGQNVSYAAKQLGIEGVDIVVPLREASKRAQNLWEQSSLVPLCLERDMVEGYELALEVLRSKEDHAEYVQKQVYDQLRKYTDVSGSYAEVADWLEQSLKL